MNIDARLKRSHQTRYDEGTDEDHSHPIACVIRRRHVHCRQGCIHDHNSREDLLDHEDHKVASYRQDNPARTALDRAGGASRVYSRMLGFDGFGGPLAADQFAERRAIRQIERCEQAVAREDIGVIDLQREREILSTYSRRAGVCKPRRALRKQREACTQVTARGLHTERGARAGRTESARSVEHQ
eukprot:229316-Prymnesium_polylepis.1